MEEKVLLSETKELLSRISPDHLPLGSYLAGGTAVALHLGHRRSADLDFFTPSEFVETAWQEKLEKELGFKLLKRDWQTLIGNVGGVKVSLLGCKHRLISKLEFYLQIKVASLPDLGAMKLETVLGRGTKRDLIDIYFLAQKFGLDRLFEFYQEKYGNLEERELMLKKGLIFFEEADRDEMPQMLVPIEWEKIKEWFLKEVPKLQL